MRKFNLKALMKFRGMLHIDNNDLAGTIFISGTGRSGTTWVQELINHDNKHRVIFEPFHSKKTKLLTNRWESRQYVSTKEPNSDICSDIDLILSGKVRSFWTDQFNKKIFCRKRIVKDIRAQLFLQWISTKYPNMPIIHIIRNPESVVRSKLRLGWDSDLSTFERQTTLLNDHLAPFLPAIKSASTPLEKHTFLWCVENYIPLKCLPNDSFLLLFYENLINHPEREINRIFDKIGKPIPHEIDSILNKPSALTNPNKKVLDTSVQRQEITPDIDVDRIYEICEMFGLNTLYNSKGEVLVEDETKLNIN